MTLATSSGNDGNVQVVTPQGAMEYRDMMPDGMIEIAAWMSKESRGREKERELIAAWRRAKGGTLHFEMALL